MRKTSFEFPIGLRPWAKELRLHGPAIRDGYTFSQLDCSSDSYRFSAMAGASRIAGLFSDFAKSCLGDEAFLILEFYLEEATVPGHFLFTIPGHKRAIGNPATVLVAPDS